jgi:hypothetical protein
MMHSSLLKVSSARTVSKLVADHHLILLAIVLVASFMYIINFNFAQVGVFSDDAAYIILAKSIATGQGYARINFPTPRPEVAWPIGYPLLLSPLVGLWPFNYVPLKILSILLTLGTVFILWKYLKFRVSATYALIVIALFAVNDAIVTKASFVMSEPAYLVWTFLGLYLFHRFERDKFSKWYQIALLTFVILMASLTRLIGISLGIAVILTLLWQRNLKVAIIIGAFYGLGLLPQIMLGRMAGGELFPPEVAAQVDVSTNYSRVIPNLIKYVSEHLPVITFGLFGPATFDRAARFHLLWAALLVQYSLISLILLGFFRLLKQKLTLSELYLVVYMGVLGVKTWDGPEDTLPRYLIPMLPLIYLYLVQGTDWVATFLANRFSRPVLVPLSLACIIIPTLLVHCARDIRNSFRPYGATDLTAGATWLSTHADQDAIIMSFLPLHHYLYAQRHTTYFPKVETEEELLAELDRQRISYLLVGPGVDMQHSPTPQLEPTVLKIRQFLDEHPERFQRVYEDDRALVVVYQIVRKS